MSDIPHWALLSAMERCGIHTSQSALIDWRDRTYATAVEHLAKMIAAHEEPPVDPLFDEAQKIADFNRINLSAQPRVEDALLRALRRGMELARERAA